MKRTLTLFAGATALVLAVAFVAQAVSPRVRVPIRIHVVEEAKTDTAVDTDNSGGASDSTGDLLTFHNPVLDACGSTPCAVAGRDIGSCILVVPGVWYECTWTTFLGGGSITVEGPFSLKRDTTLAITGGTGRFANARGSMELKSRPGGTKYDFIFNILP